MRFAIVFCLFIIYGRLYSQDLDIARQLSKNVMSNHSATKISGEWSLPWLSLENLWRATGDPDIIAALKSNVDKFVQPDGTILTYELEDYDLSQMALGRVCYTLYEVHRDQRYLKAANRLFLQLEHQPHTDSGCNWIDLKHPHQISIDAIASSQLFRALQQKDKANTKEKIGIDWPILEISDLFKDAKSGLLYHAYDESRLQPWAQKNAGKSPVIWTAAMADFMQSTVDFLDINPHLENPHLLRMRYADLATQVMKAADPTSRVWWQVMDRPGQDGNFLEARGSARLVSALLKGLRLGLLPMSMRPAVDSSYRSLISTFMSKDPQGLPLISNSTSTVAISKQMTDSNAYQLYTAAKNAKADALAMSAFIDAMVEYHRLNITKIGQGKSVVVDRYFNREYRDGKLFHYTWDDVHDSGFSWLGRLYTDRGASLHYLDQSPTVTNLAQQQVYIIVDPDNLKDSPKPNPITDADAKAVADWVAAGGHLMIFGNDTTNASVPQLNKITKYFGIECTNYNMNFVKNDNYPEGNVVIGPSTVFKNNYLAFVKELASLKVKKPATALASVGKEVIMATANYGKGKVFVIGDPWLYNEYINGRKLPSNYKNYEAARDLIEWSFSK